MHAYDAFCMRKYSFGSITSMKPLKHIFPVVLLLLCVYCLYQFFFSHFFRYRINWKCLQGIAHRTYIYVCGMEQFYLHNMVSM